MTVSTIFKIRFKGSVISTFILLLYGTISYSQSTISLITPTNKSDSLWLALDNDMFRFNALSQKKEILNKFELDLLMENYRSKIRLSGISFWQNYPNDVRRDDWLLWTLTQPPSYLDAIKDRFDSNEKMKWNILFQGFKKQYLDSVAKLPAEIAFRKRIWFNILELRSTIADGKILFRITGEKFDIDKFTVSFMEIAKDAQNSNFFRPLLMVGDKIISDDKMLGTNLAQINSFLQKLTQLGIADLNTWIAGKNDILQAKKNAISLSFLTKDGKIMDLKNLRGKVVLIDFWATWCGSCLEYMPVVKQIYEKYHHKGFEVLSVSINKNSEKQSVLAIEKKLGTSWPIAIIGDEALRKEIWKKFNFNSIPQLLLIDKDGMLIENNGRLMNSYSFDDIVKEALN